MFVFLIIFLGHDNLLQIDENINKLSREQIYILNYAKDGEINLNSVLKISNKDAFEIQKCKAFVSLDGLISLSDASLQIIAKKTGGLSLSGLTELTKNQAEILKKTTSLKLNGLKKIDIVLSRILAEVSDLELSGLVEIDSAVFFELTKGSGLLKLDGLKNLTLNLAACLEDREKNLFFGSITCLSDEVFSKLIKSRCECCFPKIKYLNQYQSKNFRFCQGSLEFPGLTIVNDDLIDSLNLLNKEIIRLPSVEEISDSVAAKICSIRQRQFYLPSIKHLTIKQCFLFGLCSGKLYLDGLSNLDSEQSFWLSKFYGFISLNGLGELPEGVALNLGNHRGDLWLNGIKKISNDTAFNIRIHSGSLYLNGLKTINDHASECISKNRADNYFSRVIDLDLLSIVKKIANYNCEFFSTVGFSSDETISLDSIENLTDSQVAFLVKAQKKLYLNGLKKISTIQAMHFSKMKKNLCLGGLLVIDDDIAKQFSVKEGPIFLSNLKSLSDYQSLMLSKIKGGLGLGSLKSINKKQATFFSYHEGFLDLSGLVELDFETAKILSAHKGPIVFGNNLNCDFLLSDLFP